MDKLGKILVADTGNNRIQLFSKLGKYLETIGTKGTGEGELESPNSVIIDRLGNILIADARNHRIQTFCPTTK